MADAQRIKADSFVNHHAVTPTWESKSKKEIAQWFSDNGFARGYNSDARNWNGLINPFTGKRSYAQAHAVGQRVNSTTPDATDDERKKGYRIFWIVKDPWNVITYGAGNWDINRRAINLEHLGDYRNYPLRTNDKKVIADFWRGRDRQLSGNTAVYGHIEVSQTGTVCPARIMESRDEIVKLINAANSGWPAPEPSKPTKPTWKPMDTPRHMLTAEKLRPYDLVKGVEVGDPIAANTDMDMRTKTTWNGKEYLRTKYSTDNSLDVGILSSKLKEVPEPEPEKPTEPTPEPVKLERTVALDTAQQYIVTKDTQLVTIPEGVVFTSDVYKAGLIITLAEKLIYSDGSEFYRTAYSRDREIFAGFKTDTVEPYTPPVVEEPEETNDNPSEVSGEDKDNNVAEITQAQKDARVEAMKTVGRNGLLGAISALLTALVNWGLSALAGVQLPVDVVVALGGLVYAGALWLDNFLHVKGKQVETKVKGLIGF